MLSLGSDNSTVIMMHNKPATGDDATPQGNVESSKIVSRVTKMQHYSYVAPNVGIDF